MSAALRSPSSPPASFPRNGGSPPRPLSASHCYPAKREPNIVLPVHPSGNMRVHHCPIPRILHVAFVPGPLSPRSFVGEGEAPSMGHRWWWFLGGDEKKRGNVEWMVSPACSLRKLNLDRASEGNGFGVRVCVCGYRVRNFIKGPFLG